MTKEELQKYVGNVAKVSYSYEFRNFEDTYSVIASIKQVDEKFGYVYLGHTYDLDKGYTTCGEAGVRYDYDKISIEPITQKEFDLWMSNYKKFHEEVIKDKGYDSCEEDVTKYTRLEK